jgi:hypothetical protein
MKNEEQFQRDIKLVQESLRRTFKPTRFEMFLDTWLSLEMLLFIYPAILGISTLIYKILI